MRSTALTPVSPKTTDAERLRHYIEDSWIEGPMYRVLAEHEASLAEDPGTPDP